MSQDRRWDMTDGLCNMILPAAGGTKSCGKEAEFQIYGDFGHPEDVADACEDHVGVLLGTPEWAEKMYGRESHSWTVVPL